MIVSCEGSHVTPWQNEKLPVEKRVEDKLRRMKPGEKLDVRTTEVPAGFPLGIEMAATWNPDLVGEEARAIAHEALALGKDQVLAPDVQSYGGDPWLAARLTVAFVGASQEEGIIATPKFFPAEAGQDERTLREVKFPPFRAAVEEAGAWSILEKGDDPYLLDDVLKKDWGFKGFVLPGVLEKQSETRRMLGALFATGYFDRQRRTDGVIDAAERSQVVRRASQQSVVLVKNEGAILPLESPKIHTVAVIGHTLPEGIRERAGALIQVGFASGDDVQAAIELARKSDVAIVTADKLIAEVARANPRTIVLLTAGPVASASHWIDRVPAVVTAWSTGGVAEVLFGDVNPSGRLPVSDDPLFPFGHGLSYTTFAYSDLKVFPATPRYGQIVQVNMNVRNTGTRAGAEVVECYVHQAKPSVERPEKELKAFSRVELKPGETKSVSMILDRRSMWFFDPAMHDWAVEPGVYDVLIGESLRDIRLKGSFELFQ